MSPALHIDVHTPELRLAPMARALVADNAHTRELARHLPEEHPLAMQLLGPDPDVLAEANTTTDEERERAPPPPPRVSVTSTADCVSRSHTAQ